MKYTVTWKPHASDQLAEIWLDQDQNRAAISAAADRIDRLLKSDPEKQGESRSGIDRIVIVAPLVVVCEVNQPDRIVSILSVAYHPRP